MILRFALVGEGPSERSLVSPLQDLCIACGASEVVGEAPDLRRLRNPVGRDVASLIKAITRLEPNADIVFVHRDANGGRPDDRYAEIAAGIEEAGAEINWVGVVPIRETETWALLDEQQIRLVADNPDGRIDLELPRRPALERMGDPKERLRETLARASGLAGRRLHDFKLGFGRRRALLLERIDVKGPIRSLSARQRLERDLREAVERVDS